MAAAGPVLLPNVARAQCSTGWDARGKHLFIQKGTYASDIMLEQKGRVITGTASAQVDRKDGGIETISGPVDGTIDGDSFSLQIFWNNDQTGIYNATVLPSGRLDGQAYEKNSPNIRVPWHTDNVFVCPAPPPAPKPIRSSGKARPAQAPPTPPFITATQPIKLPNLMFSSVYLGWDGGPDHPKPEVWVSINDQTEVSAGLLYGDVLKQPRIPSVELKLQPGLYKFFLKDGGTTLSTVVVAVP
jgi:hypothetical protein